MGIGRVIHGRSAMGGLYLLPESWYRENAITVWRNTIANDIDIVNKRVDLGTRESLLYDKLILATGASAFVPQIPGNEKPGNFVLREADDAIRIRSWCQRHNCQTAVVYGGGILGVEAADALRQLGLRTTLIHRAPRLVDRQLDEHASEILRHFLEGLGITVRCGAQVSEISGQNRVENIQLSDGEMISADVFLVCAGIQPNVDLALDTGLRVERGIVVDDNMRTSNPDVYAIGDAAEFEKTIGGLWPISMDQAKVAASSITGGDLRYSTHLSPVHIKIGGIDIKSYGNATTRSETEEFTHIDSTGSKWRRVLIDGDRVVGAVFINEPRYASVVWDAMKKGERLTGLSDDLRRGDWGKVSDRTGPQPST